MRNPDKIDRRVIYTKKAIRDSFIELQMQKPIEKISVTEICKSADINRGTFYSHYSDPYKLRESLQNELVSAIEKRIAERGSKHLSCVETFELFRENKELCRIFTGPYADKATLLDIVAKQADALMSEHSKYIANIPEEQADYIRMFVVSVVSITVKQWFDNELRDDPQRLAEMLEKFCFCGIGGFAELE